MFFVQHFGLEETVLKYRLIEEKSMNVSFSLIHTFTGLVWNARQLAKFRSVYTRSYDIEIENAVVTVLRV